MGVLAKLIWWKFFWIFFLHRFSATAFFIIWFACGMIRFLRTFLFVFFIELTFTHEDLMRAARKAPLSNMVVALQGVTPPPFTLPTRHRNLALTPAAMEPAAVLGTRWAGLQQLHGHVDTWDAVQDELLLRVLQSMRDGMLRRAEQTEKGLEAAARRADAVGFQLRAANCGLELLAQSQFLEHRIEPEECAEVSVEEAAEDLWPEDEPPPESEMDAIRRALDLGQGGLSAAQEEWSALPAVVGSEAWQAVATTAAPSLAEFLNEAPEETVPETEGLEGSAADNQDAPEEEWQATETHHVRFEPAEGESEAPAPRLASEPNLASQLNALLAARGGPL
ncbi:unnamed protein product, partial [Effrenium voratum]